MDNDKYIGRLLDNRYEILEVIGTGGMAVVYKARCHRLNRLVAIKILKDDNLDDEDFRRRFHAESQAVAMLSHPNIVSVYDVSTSVMADYIVMELIEGITLKQYMEKKGVLNWKETLHFAIQIAKALEHAHSRGIVHRDIKPHNVMVLKNGSVKVTDFGIARVMSQSNTLTKEALGSVHYISPEQAKGGRVDNRSDIYSLGVVMYEMMSGRPPYDGESPVAVAIKHINGGAPMPSTLNPNIPGGLEQIIMHAMALEPSDRYDTASGMLKDLDEFRKDPGILFDYNVPPLDEVIHIQRPPLVLQPDQPKTIAEQTVEKKRASTPAAPKRNAELVRTNTAGARRKRDPKEEQRNKVATAAIIACSAVLVLAIVVFLIVLFSDGTGKAPQTIEVPYLIGQDYENLTENPDYTVKLNDKVYDSDYEAGQIISQNPESGGQMNKGEAIYVTVSLGEVPVTETMPNLGTWELTEAQRAINNLNMNLTIKITHENHDEIPKDSVIRTNPEVGTLLETGQEIELVVSLGVEHKVAAMPDIVEEEKDDAEQTLKDLKLDLEITFEEIYDSNIPEGQVVRTSPEADEEIVTGDKVTVYISKGVQLVPMSAVLNLNVDTAINILKSDGFANYTIETVNSDKPKETVIGIKVDGEEVKPSTKTDASKTVTLVVSLGQAQITKTVTIDLRNMADDGDCEVVIKCNGETVFEKTVTQGTKSVVLENQTGSGKVTYWITVDEMEGWTQQEDFS